MHWTLETVLNLTWGQLLLIQNALRNADGDTTKTTHITTDKNKMTDEENQDELARKILAAKREDGTVDLGKVMSSKR
jgi:hypothetical protein